MFGLKPFGMLSSPIRILLIANVVIFAIGNLLPVLGNYLVAYGALRPVFYTDIWRYLTYAFLHGGFWHLAFNMLSLWMFGDDVATEIGYRRFWILYLFCAVFAGVFSIPFYLMGVMSPFSYIVGASGALMGVFVAYAWLFPNRGILMFFVIPMRIKYAIWFFIALDVLLARSNDSVAHFTHLGGVLSGFLCMYLFTHNIWYKLRGEFRESRRDKPRRTQDEPLEGEVAYLDKNRQLDMILKKVSESGVSSLSPSEKDFLLKESARRRGRRF